MNRLESNPLRRELARGRCVEPHPDYDVLTALSEDALQQRERQKVLAHLAACADCREVLSVAAAAAIDTADDLMPFVQTRSMRQEQRTWLPWASVAAGLLIVCSAVLVYQQKLAFQTNTAVATKEAMQHPSSMHQQAPLLPPQKEKETETLSKGGNSHRSSRLQAPLPSQNSSVANAIPEARIATAKKSDFSQQNSHQTIVKAGEDATLGAQVLKAAPATSVSAFANAAPARGLSSASVAASARQHWRINSLGQPERSFSDGPWQAVLPFEQFRMRVVSVVDSEVWIGGDSSRLYHSTDNGTTWNLVALPDKDGRGHSIAHIHFQTAQSGTVESDDGAVWTTSNGGSTWK